jgi:hypothetical protein
MTGTYRYAHANIQTERKLFITFDVKRTREGYWCHFAKKALEKTGLKKLLNINTHAWWIVMKDVPVPVNNMTKIAHDKYNSTF